MSEPISPVDQPGIKLPPVPAELRNRPVAGWSEPVRIDSYLPLAPDRFPAFLDRRVYQGSSGRVFPLPFHERISPRKTAHSWQALHLQNDWIRVMVLPELGGRIHLAYDRVADYDLFYRNTVIKPALVGLAGPWLSGGVEFNWPQHHRPATFLPTDVSIENEPDGAVTIWCSDHDPFDRMKGMHGIRLRPDSAVIEARVRLFNRSNDTKTFLWWANVAAAVNDGYQSFFPTDVSMVADHARRAVVAFPQADRPYNGVDYPALAADDPAAVPPRDRLDWWRNIPVPTSYMAFGTRDDFFGGYDHSRDAGFVHWADHRVSPGKKQWTWGNAEFGRTWEANLSDHEGPYIELMAGVYTDNQPDFAYLLPGETKTFSQYWYPIHRIGPVQQASVRAAGRLDLTRDSSLLLGVCTPLTERDFTVTVEVDDGTGTRTVRRSTERIGIGTPLQQRIRLRGPDPAAVSVRVELDGTEVLRLGRPPTGPAAPAVPEVVTASEPPRPQGVSTVEELYLIGEYLSQHRHATRSPVDYWREALRRDPGDTRCNTALAARLARAGLHRDAEPLLRAAVQRRNRWVPTPNDAEAHYRLGLLLAATGRPVEAGDYLARAGFSATWVSAAQLEMARIACRRGTSAGYADAEQLLRQIRARDPQQLQAADLLAALLQHTGRPDEATDLLTELRAMDPLDAWAAVLTGEGITDDPPTLLDVALEFATAGFDDRALATLELAERALPRTALGQVAIGPLIEAHRAAIAIRAGRLDDARVAASRLENADPRWCLPSRPEDVAALESVLALVGDPAGAPLAGYLLGCWYLHADRGREALRMLTAAAGASPRPEVAVLIHRTLGVARYNVAGDPDGARRVYLVALELAPSDPRLIYESDQLASRTGVSDAERLERLQREPEAVAAHDGLAVNFAQLLTATGHPDRARELLAHRRFQPWEGGEGAVLAAWQDACRAMAEQSLAAGKGSDAITLVNDALHPPAPLGEARHPLADTSALQLLLGDALAATGDQAGDDRAWQRAAGLQAGAPRTFGPQTGAAVTALRRLGRGSQADTLTDEFARYVEEFAAAPATIDFFATSLPSLLLFHADPQQQRDDEVAIMRGVLRTLVRAQPGAD
jgi:tetratricopeptide (TPR) repeat protein